MGATIRRARHEEIDSGLLLSACPLGLEPARPAARQMRAWRVADDQIPAGPRHDRQAVATHVSPPSSLESLIRLEVTGPSLAAELAERIAHHARALAGDQNAEGFHGKEIQGLPLIAPAARSASRAICRTVSNLLPAPKSFAGATLAA